MRLRPLWPVLVLAFGIVCASAFVLWPRYLIGRELARRSVTATILHSVCGHETQTKEVERSVLATLVRRPAGASYRGWRLIRKTPRTLALLFLRRDLCPRCRKSRFLGIARGFVAVYAGTPEHPGEVLEVTGIRADALPAPELADLRRGIPFADAKERLQLLEGLAALLND